MIKLMKALRTGSAITDTDLTLNPFIGYLCFNNPGQMDTGSKGGSDGRVCLELHLDAWNTGSFQTLNIINGNIIISGVSSS